jgi:hypothetical protein
MTAGKTVETLRVVVLSVVFLCLLMGMVPVAFSGSGGSAGDTTAQLDFSSIYNQDVVYGAGDGTDGDFDGAGRALVSSSAATNNAQPGDDGLPDDGVFQAVAGVHPRFELPAFDSNDANAWQTTGTGSVTAPVTNGQYETVHVIASAGGAGVGNPAEFQIQLHYADSSTDVSDTLTAPDWYSDPGVEYTSSDGQYQLRDGLDRYDAGYDNADDPAIWGYAVSADSSKTLEEVTIDVTTNNADAFNFFGGAATTQRNSELNAAPTANDDFHSTDEDTSATVDVVSNDSDGDGDSLAVTDIPTGPSHGTAQITGMNDHQIQFDPGNDQTSNVTITYEVSDGNGGTDTADLNVTVTARNDAPSFTRNESLAGIGEDTTVNNGNQLDSTELFGDEFSDVEGDSFAGVVVTDDNATGSEGTWQYSTNDGTDWYDIDDGSLSASNGLLLSSTTDIRFNPAAEYNGNPGNLTVYAVDGSAGTTFTSGATRNTFDTTVDGASSPVASGSNTVGITVTAVEDMPVAATGFNQVVTEGTQVTFDASGSSDPDNNITSYEWDWTSDGTYEASGARLTAPTHTYADPGTYTVTLQVTDGAHNVDKDTVEIVVEAAGSSGGSGGGGSFLLPELSDDTEETRIVRDETADNEARFEVDAGEDETEIVLDIAPESEKEVLSETDDGQSAESTGERPAVRGGVGVENVAVDQLSIRPTETGQRTFELTVRDWGIDTEALGPDEQRQDSSGRGDSNAGGGRTNVAGTASQSDPAAFLADTGASPIGYVQVNHTNPDTDIENVSFQFSVRKAYLDETGVGSESVALYRDETDRWNELDATKIDETDQYHRFEATSPGLSLFTIGSTRPVFEVTAASAETTEIGIGETATVQTTVRNLGGVEGTHTVVLTADGERVASADVAVPARSEATLELSFEPETAGAYDLVAAEEDAGVLSVEAMETDDGATDPGSASDDSADDPSIGVLVGLLSALGVVLVAVVVWRRRDRETDEERPR